MCSNDNTIQKSNAFNCKTLQETDSNENYKTEIEVR